VLSDKYNNFIMMRLKSGTPIIVLWGAARARRYENLLVCVMLHIVAGHVELSLVKLARVRVGRMNVWPSYLLVAVA